MNLDSDDEQRERLDMENDFEGGVEIGGEFFYQSKRQKRQQTKDDQLYGVFAEGSSDEEDRRRKLGRKPAADYSKPVGFVSSGVGMGSAEHPAPATNGAGPSTDAQPAPQGDGLGFGGAGSGGVGLGFASAGGGLGFNANGGLGSGAFEGGGGLGSSGSGVGGLGSSGGGLGHRSGAAGGAPSFTSGSRTGGSMQQPEEPEVEDAVLPTNFGKAVLDAAERRKRERLEKSKREKKREANVKQGDIGAFETHSRGMASRMMEKMGCALERQHALPGLL